MAEYGIPYMGSKSSICNELIRIFPKADHFYDLFGGGFSVTHAMLLRRSKDYKRFHFNEIRPGICELIKDAIAGKHSYENFKPPFISREEFAARKEFDPYIKILWSFGNSGKSYLFSKEIEPYKRSMHNAIIFNEFDDLAQKTLGIKKFNDGYHIKDRRFFLRNRVEFFRKTKVPDFLWPFLKEDALGIVKANKESTEGQTKQLQPLQHLERLEQLQHLERLERLQHLERLEQLQHLERLELTSVSYSEVSIKDNSVVYCDPPYAGTAEYDGEFDHKEFLNWCDAQTNPVFISEYNIPDPRFKLVFKINKRSLLSSSSREVKVEKCYVNRAGYKHLKQKRTAHG